MPRILLADEETPIYTGLKNALKHEGCVVDVVHNYQDIEAILDANRYDCIIMELLLPKDGRNQPVSDEEIRNAYCQIASRTKRPPIILRQGYFTDADDQWFLAHGASFLFTRPIENGLILAALEELKILPVNQPA